MIKIIITFLLFTSILFSNTKDLEKVSLQLHWKYQFEFAGFIAALEKGFYKEEGLDVNLKEYEFGQDIIKEVLSGNSEFGIYNSNILLENLNNKPLKLVSSYFKRSALVLITKPEIKYPSDLIDKKIMAAGLDDFNLNFDYIFSLQDINTSKLNLVPHSFDVNDFADGKVDAMTAFISDQPFKLDKLGVPYNIINPSDFGIFNLQLELFTNKGFVLENRNLVERFKRASDKGWEYALENSDEIIEIILKKYNTQNLTKEFLENEAIFTQRLIMPKMYNIGSVDRMFLYKQMEVLSSKHFSDEEKVEVIDNYLFHTQEDLDKIKLELNYSIIQKTIPIVLIILIAIFYRQRLLTNYNKKLEKEVKAKTKEYKKQNKQLISSNQSFMDLIDTAIEAIAIFDDKLQLIRINESGVNILKLDENYENKNYKINDFLLKDDLSHFKIKATEVDFIPYETRIKTSENKELPVLIAGKRTIKDYKYIFILTIVDLTQIKVRDKFIQEQSKLAQMGELLNMIAHQWRQPLTSISATSENMKLRAMLNQYDKDDFIEAMNEVYHYTLHLSKTINDFRDFYKEDKEMSLTCMNNIVKKSLNIIEDSLSYKNITVQKSLESKIEIQTFEHEVTQVILSILQNAEEVLLSKKITNPTIYINTYDKDNKTYITIEDNAGGIDSEIINKVFDPYFSTKREKNGTGLGLYFAKRIIETNCNGELDVENSTNGAIFILRFPK